TVLNSGNRGPVTLFRTYPTGVETPIIDQEINDPGTRDRLLLFNAFNETVEKYLHQKAMAGEGVVLSKTNAYTTTVYEDHQLKMKLPIMALKSYMLSPFIERKHVDLVLATVREARKTATREMVESSLVEHLSDLIVQSTRNTGIEPGIDAVAEARRITSEHFA
ncbi:MAG: hypothetical protein ACKO5E_01740, partial [bacterium]